MNEILYTMALAQVGALNSVNQNVLLDTLGSASAVFEHRHDIAEVLPDATPHCRKAVSLMDVMLPRCEEEMAWAESNHIQMLCKSDPRYPARLRECPDAPILLYYRGTADLNSPHVINMVGTRQCTEYGKDICRTFLAQLKTLVPDVLVMSGLAYGIDINAHRNALQNGLPTVAVLAHGLDQIYPRVHRDTAVEMLKNGGLLTEYMTRTNADKKNFVARNRIVAGTSDATIVVESAQKGGSLITAEVAFEYGRDVFAFPGRITDEYSAGCNKIIREQQAACITSAEDFCKAMGWMDEGKQHASADKPIQRELFVDLDPDEQRVVDALKGADSKALNVLTIETALPIGKLTSLLFTLEMKGVVKMLNGGRYRLL